MQNHDEASKEMRRIVENFVKTSGLKAKIVNEEVMLAPNRFFDAIVLIEVGQVQQYFVVEHKRQITDLNFLSRFTKEIPPSFLPMIISTTITKDAKKFLKDRGIAYICEDTDFYFPLHNFEYFNRKEIYKKQIKPRRNLNGMGEIKLGYVLAGQDCTRFSEMKIVDLAKHLNISSGHVSAVLKMWINLGIISRNNHKIEIVNIESFVRRWAATYTDMIKHHASIYVGSFRVKKNKVGSLGRIWRRDLDGERWWGGESGAALLTDYLEPEVVTLYSNEPLQKDVIEFQLEEDPKGNFIIFRPFWTDILELTKYVKRDYADPIVLYADLVYSPSSRVQEVAEIIFQRYFRE